ncbi:hypothetical protein NA57DRAFT_76674 [Rhizodiscina lignyota]|uniref:Uncharacterized protein n=1 Tax=Rhizodiscina lignyota TaxID=1504668 RepID=A0A9P4M5B6_9PEZI|nr:hypothetical protein NA57DRAFT_76674 [Rhizodiscina lignyota]
MDPRKRGGSRTSPAPPGSKRVKGAAADGQHGKRDTPKPTSLSKDTPREKEAGAKKLRQDIHVNTNVSSSPRPVDSGSSASTPNTRTVERKGSVTNSASGPLSAVTKALPTLSEFSTPASPASSIAQGSSSDVAHLLMELQSKTVEATIWEQRKREHSDSKQAYEKALISEKRLDPTWTESSSQARIKLSRATNELENANKAVDKYYKDIKTFATRISHVVLPRQGENTNQVESDVQLQITKLTERLDAQERENRELRNQIKGMESATKDLHTLENATGGKSLADFIDDFKTLPSSFNRLSGDMGIIEGTVGTLDRKHEELRKSHDQFQKESEELRKLISKDVRSLNEDYEIVKDDISRMKRRLERSREAEVRSTSRRGSSPVAGPRARDDSDLDRKVTELSKSLSTLQMKIEKAPDSKAFEDLKADCEDIKRRIDGAPDDTEAGLLSVVQGQQNWQESTAARLAKMQEFMNNTAADVECAEDSIRASNRQLDALKTDIQPIISQHKSLEERITSLDAVKQSGPSIPSNTSTKELQDLAEKVAILRNDFSRLDDEQLDKDEIVTKEMTELEKRVSDLINEVRTTVEAHRTQVHGPINELNTAVAGTNRKVEQMEKLTADVLQKTSRILSQQQTNSPTISPTTSTLSNQQPQNGNVQQPPVHQVNGHIQQQRTPSLPTNAHVLPSNAPIHSSNVTVPPPQLSNLQNHILNMQQHVHNLDQTVQHLVGQSRVNATSVRSLEQRYDNISTDDMAKRMVNQMQVMFPFAKDAIGEIRQLKEEMPIFRGNLMATDMHARTAESKAEKAQEVAAACKDAVEGMEQRIREVETGVKKVDEAIEKLVALNVNVSDLQAKHNSIKGSLESLSTSRLAPLEAWSGEVDDKMKEVEEEIGKAHNETEFQEQKLLRLQRDVDVMRRS